MGFNDNNCNVSMNSYSAVHSHLLIRRQQVMYNHIYARSFGNHGYSWGLSLIHLKVKML